MKKIFKANFNSIKEDSLYDYISDSIFGIASSLSDD